tara:strand:- start:24296 stop:26428 length:2133 start_codon:yes stop_codon:yes gene_type:complete
MKRALLPSLQQCSKALGFTLIAMLMLGLNANKIITPANAITPAATVQEHIVDSSQKGGAVMLDTGWRVFRNQLIEPRTFINATCELRGQSRRSESVKLPDFWGPAFTTDTRTGHGTATYCLEVSLPQDSQTLGLHLGIMRSIFAVYAINIQAGRLQEPVLLHQNGDPGNGFDEEPKSPYLPDLAIPNDMRHFKLIVLLDNHVHKQGGFITAPTIDVLARLDAQQRRTSALQSALMLVLFAVAIAALLIGKTHDDRRRHFIFAALAASSAFRVFMVSDQIWDYVPSLTLARKYDLEYVSLFLIASSYYAFICSLFRKDKMHPVDKVMYSLSAACCIFAIFLAPFFPPGTITLLREPFQIFCIAMCVVLAVLVVRALLIDPSKRIDAAIVMASALITLVYEMLSSAMYIRNSMELSQLLIIFVTALYVRNFVSGFRRVEAERDALTSSLQKANADLEQRAQALTKAFARAEESSRAKSEFLATMSHELRTPLNAVIGFSEMMTREIFGKLGAPQYEGYAKDIYNSGTHLLAVVNDILDLSRVETGNDEVQDEPVNTTEIAKLVLSFVKPQAERANVSCHLEVIGDLPQLRADPRKLKQILINLVSNAIKFNNSGGQVTIQLQREPVGFAFRVIDTGIGMRPDEIPKAMARFGQIDGALNRKYEGLGIGLSIVQALSAQHGALFQIDSEFGMGTCATVTFPSTRCLDTQALSA